MVQLRLRPNKFFLYIIERIKMQLQKKFPNIITHYQLCGNLSVSNSTNYISTCLNYSPKDKNNRNNNVVAYVSEGGER